MRSIIVIAHNIRSAHNIGSIFRTCEGFGVDHLILSGYSPYPDRSLSTKTLHDPIPDDRLPHIRAKVTVDIHKTALGAECFVPFDAVPEVDFTALRSKGYCIVGLEQSPTAIPLADYRPSERIALILGEEVHGITQDYLSHCEDIIEIPMYGKKESFNVSVAAGIALYQLRVM